MLALALTVALAQVPLEADIDDPRMAPRFRWAVHAIGVYSMGGSRPGAGIGLQLEAGVVLQDTISLTARLFAATLGFTGDAGGALGVDFALGRFFTLGTGLSAHGFYFWEAGQAAMVGIPIRLTFNPLQRSPDAVRRKTLILGRSDPESGHCCRRWPHLRPAEATNDSRPWRVGHAHRRLWLVVRSFRFPDHR